MDSTKRFEPCLLCEVFSDFGVSDISKYVIVDAALISDNERTEGFSVTALGAISCFSSVYVILKVLSPP